MLIIKGLTKEYDKNDKAVLKNISLKLNATGLVFIVGESGSGKSTLLNLIGGNISPTKGNIIYNGKDITKFNKKEMNKYHRNNVGFIYQNYNLIEYLNVIDNINLIDKHRNVDKILKDLKILDKKYYKVNNLSGGEKQRVSIARTLISNPNIILADEPTGALDHKNSLKIMGILKSISKNKLVIVVTHDTKLARMYGDRIIKLNDGKMERDIRLKTIPDNKSYQIKKSKIKFKNIKDIAIKHLLYKYKRNILTLIALCIGLLSLSLVMGISNGFNKTIDEEEKTSLARYPIYISEYVENLELTSDKYNQDNLLHINNLTFNKLDNNIISSILKLEDKTDNIVISSSINDVTTNVVYGSLDNFNLICGNLPVNEDEILLIVNNSYISNDIILYLNLDEDNYTYEELMNYKINDKKIVGIIDTYNTYYEELTGIITISNDNMEPNIIYLYPIDYESKNNIIDYLNTLDIKYTDYAKTIKSLSNTIISGIEVVLILFSFLSLLVSTIMIGIITYISIIERIKEIGLYKSMGMSNKNIINLFLYENILLGIFSSLMTIIFYLLISIPINNIFNNFTGINNLIQFDKSIFMIIIYISILLNIIGSYIPLIKINKLEILDCLRYEN